MSWARLPNLHGCPTTLSAVQLCHGMVWLVLASYGMAWHGMAWVLSHGFRKLRIISVHIQELPSQEPCCNGSINMGYWLHIVKQIYVEKIWGNVSIVRYGHSQGTITGWEIPILQMEGSLRVLSRQLPGKISSFLFFSLYFIVIQFMKHFDKFIPGNDVLVTHNL